MCGVGVGGSRGCCRWVVVVVVLVPGMTVLFCCVVGWLVVGWWWVEMCIVDASIEFFGVLWFVLVCVVCG